MKSYKDIDKSIVMNAPEGAMWVCLLGYIPYYYRLDSGILQVFDADHSLTWRQSLNDMLKGSWVKDLIPLPNIEIPWEATKDSECPVPDDVVLDITWGNGKWHERGISGADCCWNSGDRITSYKIIDEKYLPSEDDPAIEALVEHLSKEEQKVHTFTWQQPVTITLPDNPNLELIKHLEFLQILANKFPEIKDKVVEYMNIELKCWWHETSGHLTYEEQEGE